MYADRFWSPLFQGAMIRIILGRGGRLFGQEDGEDLRKFRWESERPTNGPHRPMIFHDTAGGTVWGDTGAVNEFVSLAEPVCGQQPAELFSGIGIVLFPPTMCNVPTSFESNWWHWRS